MQSIQGGLLIAAIGLLSVGSWASAQEARPQYNPAGQSLYWLNMPQLAKELEIVGEQKDQLDKIRGDNSMKLQEMYKKLSEVPQEERGAKYGELARELGEETEKKIQAVLLPHQTKRLQQIMLQVRMQSMGYGYSPLGGEEFGKALQLTDEQKAALKEKETEVRKEIAEKTAEFQKKLQSDAKEKLLSVLTAAQRKMLDELIGEKFEWQGGAWGGLGGGGRVIEKK